MAQLTEMPEFLSVDQLAQCLGIGRDVLYREVKAGKIPGGRKVGRYVRIHRDTVLRWFRGSGAAQNARAT